MKFQCGHDWSCNYFYKYPQCKEVAKQFLLFSDGVLLTLCLKHASEYKNWDNYLKLSKEEAVCYGVMQS